MLACPESLRPKPNTVNALWRRSSTGWLCALWSNAPGCGCNNTKVKILLSLQASHLRDVGLATNIGCSMAAELVKVKAGSSSSKLAGAAAALLPSRNIDSCARRTSDDSVSIASREVYGMTKMSVPIHHGLQHSLHSQQSHSNSFFQISTHS